MDTEAAQPQAGPVPEEPPAGRQPPLGRIGPYELRAVLSHDGLGRVFRAWDTKDGVDVMVTLLDLETEARHREAIISKLQRAVLDAAALKHPGLVRIHDAGVVGQGVYIVNEWVAGRSLGLAQRAGWQPTARVAAAVVRDLAQALAHAHAHGVLHGGLNPSNVILDANDRALVLGLGYAGPAHASDVPSMDPLVSGAAPYMAPEQLQGGAVDERTDVHALGVLLYELLAGHRAYPGETVPEVARALMSHDPAPPHWLRLDVPERLSAIAMQALQRNPAARYAQAGQMAAALSAWLEQSAQEVGDARDYLEPVKARPKPPNRRKHRLTAALLLAAGAVVAFAWVDKPGAGPASRPASGAPAPAGAASGVVSGVVSGEVSGDAAPAVGVADATAENAAGRSLTDEFPAKAAEASETAEAPSSLVANDAATTGATAAATTVAGARPLAAAAPAVPTPEPVAVASARPSTEQGALPTARSTAPAPVRSRASDTPAAPATSRPPVRERPRPAAAEPKATAAPVPVQTGTVQLAVSPWGYVEVGGKLAGASPPLQKLTLPEGSHTITIRNEDFAPFVTTVQVSADKAATVRHRFPQ